MSKTPSFDQARDRVEQLEALLCRGECRTCECLQGLLTQLELDCAEAAELVKPLKVAAEEMHECLGCDPCPPGEAFAQYLRWCNEPAAGREDDVRGAVREEYARIATQGGSCCGSSASCCGGPSAGTLAAAIGYGDDELAGLPEGANLGLSCGNPTALASLRPGEVVLDLGSGAGFDAFIAARKVGPTGRVIGVDMTPQMLEKARANAIAFREETGLDNVEFRLGEIEHLPVADSSVDVVISNCVINLSPDKPQVWRDIARVLKPGGRVAVSDIALKQPLPEALKQSVEALVGCVAGAVLVEDTERMARQAGLAQIRLGENAAAVDAMTGGNDALLQSAAALLPPGRKPSDYIVSLNVSARKEGPRRAGQREDDGDGF
jgi:ubiquinone/menaquinone biosynthesis C-methylase UbiE